jgi:hypothetical protein
MRGEAMKKYAEISLNEKCRYLLGRDWSDDPKYTKGTVVWVMLNPSTADAQKDDATIRRCITFSKSWDYKALEVVNLFPYRATNPKDLPRLIRESQHVSGIVSVGTESFWEKAIRGAELVVLAWGDQPILRQAVGKEAIEGIVGLLREIHKQAMCLGTTKSGMPKHPVRLPNGLVPIPWNAR